MAQRKGLPLGQVESDDWPKLVEATSRLRTPGAREIIPKLERRGNEPMKVSPALSPTAIKAVNLALWRAGLMYRLRSSKTGSQRPKKEFIRLWRIIPS